MVLKRRIFSWVAGFHFAVIILHNISSTTDGYQRVYADHGNTNNKNLALSSIQRINQLSPIMEYARFSGTETGFGFFAPQVGSQYISHFKTFDAEGGILSETIAPSIHQQEALLRYSSFLDLFQDMLHADKRVKQDPKESDSLDIRYARAIVYSMAERVLNGALGASKVDAEIYLYNYPSLKDYKLGKRPRYIPIYQLSVTLKPSL